MPHVLQSFGSCYCVLDTMGFCLLFLGVLAKMHCIILACARRRWPYVGTAAGPSAHPLTMRHVMRQSLHGILCVLHAELTAVLVEGDFMAVNSMCVT
jgi:hypothetical protein